MAKFETDEWQYVPAKYRGANRGSRVRVGVLHSTESNMDAAATARYFQRPDKPSSTHITAGEDGIVQSVFDSFVAYTAPGANHDGIQIEQQGYAGWSEAKWLSRIKTLRNTAKAVSQYSMKYGLPIKRMSNNELRAGKKGWVDHNQVSQVYGKSTHWDCGRNYPFGYVLEELVPQYMGLSTKPNVVNTNYVDYQVALVWDQDNGTPDEGAARTLGVAHKFIVLPLGHPFKTGIEIGIGTKRGEHDIVGANRHDTAMKVAQVVCNKDWGDRLRLLGREFPLR